MARTPLQNPKCRNPVLTDVGTGGTFGGTIREGDGCGLRHGTSRHRLSVELPERIQLAGSGTEQQKAPATRESLNGPLTSRHALSEPPASSLLRRCLPSPLASHPSQVFQQHRWWLSLGDECIHSRRGTFWNVELPRQHDNGDVRMRAPDLASYCIPIHLRHPIVQDHKPNRMPFEEPQPDPAAAGRDHVVASVLEDEPPCMEPLRVIVNTEDQLLLVGLPRYLCWTRHRTRTSRK